MNQPIIIAEVKTTSPFGYQSSKSWEELFELANIGGDWLSIHTDSRWGGSFELLKKARSMTDKPILAKGIHASDQDIKKAIEFGADYVLVVGRAPDVYREKLLIEPTTFEQLKNLNTKLKVVWNARDLDNGQVKKEQFSQARRVFSGWLCQASFVRAAADVHPRADAVLVGENLEEFLVSFGRI